MKFIKFVAIALFAVGTGIVFLDGSAFVGMSGTGVASSAQELLGAELYKANCAKCHGENGSGGHAPDLTAEKRQAKWVASDSKLVGRITHGTIGMPAFGKKLTAANIQSIADYVRTLKSAIASS